MTEQQATFHRIMLALCQRRDDELGYKATKILHKISEIGAIETAKWVIRIPSDSSGLTRLWELERAGFTARRTVCHTLHP